MRRSFLRFSLRFASVTAVALTTSALALLAERPASACGAYIPPSQTVGDVTDQRILLSVSPTQSTLYDQIEYTGAPSSFAWVLPIHGTVTVGLSADVLFDSVDALTATVIDAPPSSCPAAPSDCADRGAGCGGASADSASANFGPGATNAAPPVTVTKQQNVGPYATVQLHSTDGSALSTWLAQNGFDVPAAAKPTIDAYVAEGFDFLAMKLLPTAGVQAMRPVRVSGPGASFTLPLRMAGVGTAPTVGITVWVVSDGRYEPQNFPFFHIDDSSLIWDWSLSASNYLTLRAQDEAKLGGRGWEIESSIDLSEDLITQVVLSGGQYQPGLSAYPTVDASEDYLAEDADDGGVPEQADQVRDDDLGSLFAGMAGPTVRITRMRSDLAQAAMTSDFVIQASADQSELSNVRDVTKGVNEQCPIYDDCNVIGTGSVDQAVAVSGTSSVGGSFGQKASCVASSQPSNGRTGRFAILAAAVGLVIARVVRRRKKS